MDPRSPRARVLRAKAHRQLGNLNEALSDYSAAIELEPDCGVFWYRRGIVRRELGQNEKAIADFSKAIDINPDWHSLWGERGVTYASLGNWEQALTDTSRAVEIEDDNAHGWHWLALLHLQRGNVKEYRSVCRDMLEHAAEVHESENAHWVAWTCALGPQAVADFQPVVRLARRAAAVDAPDGWHHNTLGAALYRTRELQEAAKTLNDLVSRWGDDPPVRYSRADTAFFLAMVHHQLGQAAQAQQWMDKAIAWADNDLADKNVSWDRRAILELLRTEAEELLETPGPAAPEPSEDPDEQVKRQPKVEQPPDLRPIGDTAYLAHAELYVALGQNEEALVELEKALADPRTNHASIHRRRSRIYKEMAQFDKAIAACNEALRNEPDNAEILWELGGCHLAKGDLPQAVVAYSKCIELPDQPKPAWLRSGAVRRRGEVYMLLDQNEKARCDFEQALELEPDGFWNCSSFAEFLALYGDPSYRDPDRALELARKAVKLRPDVGAMWRVLGAAQFRQGDLDAALASSEKAEELGWDAAFLLAMVHFQQGNTDQTRHYFELGEQRLLDDRSGWSANTRRLRAEAAELLDIAETPPEKPKEETKN